MTDPIDVRRYDQIVNTILGQPNLNFETVANRCGVAASTVRKIWEGVISRPSVVLLDRLPNPRRCADCGVLCREWPCIHCEMRRRELPSKREQFRFMYRNQRK